MAGTMRPRPTLTAMPRRSQQYATPRDWVEGRQWPDGALLPDAPDVVRYALHISRQLRLAMAGRSKVDVARSAGIERTTLYDILDGRTWADTVSLARLEIALDARLWPASPPKA